MKGKEEMQLDFYTYKYMSKAQSFSSDFSFFASFPAPFINMVTSFFKNNLVHTEISDRADFQRYLK